MKIETVIENLNRRRFLAKRFATAAEAKAEMLRIIGAQSVGIGGSNSVNGTGVYETLKEQGNTVYCHTFVPAEEKEAVRKCAMTADVYLCSANAITESGRILNIDGGGNRTAATLFGPSTVIILAGKNKLVANVEEGIARTRRDCCPKNARRLGLNTPCALTDHCGDCKDDARMCNAFLILENPTRHVKAFYVFITDEEIGW